MGAAAWRLRFRSAGNLVTLATPLGVLAARLGGARIHRGPRGLLVADGYRLPLPDAPAFTVGNVVVTRKPWREAVHDNHRLLEHEEAHTWQWLAFGGLPFLPLYLLATLWSLLATGDRGRANVFERRAGLESGGYTR